MDLPQLRSPNSTIGSPTNRLRQPPPSENVSPQGRSLRQHSNLSPSQVPGSPQQRSIASQLASPQYIQQFQALMEHQRQVHGEERALWHTERTELYEKINQLEATVRRSQPIHSSKVTSSTEKNPAGNDGGFWSLLSTDNTSRKASSNETGAEVWRGSNPNIEPTRTFSNTSPQSSKPESSLPSIAENLNVKPRRGTDQDSQANQGVPHKPSISGEQIHKDLDGINFKASVLPPETAKSIMTPQSPSPQSPSPSRRTPGTIQLPSSTLEGSEDQYTKNAGHTPIARHTERDTDAVLSDPATPTQPEYERPPLEPHVSTTKTPSERAGSYFPAPPQADDIVDEDPPLKGQLGLTNNASKDKQFLETLDSKLQQAAHEPPAVAGASDEKKPEVDEDSTFDQPEPEPGLKIKRSMNFGSAFGARNPGRNV